jgi:hypothetical protein
MALGTFFIFTVPPLNQPLVELGKPYVGMEPELRGEVEALPTGEVALETTSRVLPSGYAEVTFSWTPVRPGITVAQIAQGRSVTCPFEFTGLTNYTGTVTLEIKNPKIKEMGIALATPTVREGRIESAALFNLALGGPIGFHKLVIVAKDDTGAIIGEGEIPFIALPPGAGGC